MRGSMFRSVISKSAGIFFALASMSAMSEVHADTFYVNVNAPINGNGSSWREAFNNLDSALQAASNPCQADEIWVAQGTYKPAIIYTDGFVSDSPNLVTFLLPPNTSIYGGFSGAGYENHLSQRHPFQFPTILSGDINGDDINTPGNYTNKADNAWHVLTAVNVQKVLLDGFIVQDGYAAGPDSGVVTINPNTGTAEITSLNYAFDMGAGLFARAGSTVKLHNMRFIYNAADSVNATMLSAPPEHPLVAGGGAVGVIEPGTKVTIKNCSFTNNAGINGGTNGGAIEGLFDATIEISQTYFGDNQTDRVGGAIHVRDASPSSVYECAFLRNFTTGTLLTTTTPDSSGGALGVFDSSFAIKKCSFRNNSSASSNGSGGAIFFHVPFNDGTVYTFTVKDSDFIGNTSSSVGGGAIIIFGILPNPEVLPEISNCKFAFNSAGIGGAINVDTVPAVIKKCKFKFNTAWVEGGAVMGTNYSNCIIGTTDLSARGKVTILDSIFVGNSIIGLPVGPNAPGSPLFVLNLTASATAAGAGLPPAGITEMFPGGGAVASLLGGNVEIVDSKFIGNSANIFEDSVGGLGGAILAGGSLGFAGGQSPPVAMNQGFVSICNPFYRDNVDAFGPNNTAISNPGSLPLTPEGVDIITHRHCRR